MTVDKAQISRYEDALNVLGLAGKPYEAWSEEDRSVWAELTKLSDRHIGKAMVYKSGTPGTLTSAQVARASMGLDNPNVDQMPNYLSAEAKSVALDLQRQAVVPETPRESFEIPPMAHKSGGQFYVGAPSASDPGATGGSRRGVTAKSIARGSVGLSREAPRPRTRGATSREIVAQNPTWPYS